MSDPRNARLEELFRVASKLPSEERGAYLDGACSDDESLRAELDELLTFEEARSGFPTSTGRDAAPGDAVESVGSKAVLQRIEQRGAQESRYEILGEFARGGMGAILRVWDKDLRRTLAMKVVLGRGDGGSTGETPSVDEKTLGRFLEEAQVTGQLDHPGIVPVHELGLDAQGQVYFTMRLVKGEDLKSVFEQLHAGEGSWTEMRVLGVILKVCEAMAYAHSKQVIHRDLKPANIMVGRFGEAYVMDWGLAHVAGQRDKKDLRLQEPAGLSLSQVHTDRREGSGVDSPLLTMDGDVVGTPAYMSPEQARGEVAAMGPASDVYSLGAILYQLLAGQMPYVPPDAKLNAYAIWALVQQGPPTPLAKLAPKAPEELVAICEKAMAREAGDRYDDTREMAADLQAFMEGRVVLAHRTGALAEFRKWVQRNKALAATLLVGLGLAVVGSTVWSLVLAAKNEAITRAKDEADSARGLAERRETEALEASRTASQAAQAARESERAALLAQSHYLADTSEGQVTAGDAATGVLLALEALPKKLEDPDDRPYAAEAERALRKAMRDLRETRIVPSAGTVVQALFHPDGQTILTVSSSGGAELWSLEGVRLGALEVDGSAILRAAFSADGSRILTRSDDGRARLWRSGGQLESVLVDPDSPIVDASVGAANRIFTRSSAGAVRVWSLEGRELFVLQHPDGRIEQVLSSPDGERILTWTPTGAAYLWSSEGERIAVVHDGPDRIERALFDPTGDRFLAVTRSERPGTRTLTFKVRIWSREGELRATLGEPDGLATWRDVAFSRDGSRILTTGSGTQSCRVWTDDGELLAVLPEKGFAVEVSTCPFGPYRMAFLTTSHGTTPPDEDLTARVWDHNGAAVTQLGGHETPITHAVFLPRGAGALTASSDGTLRIWSYDWTERLVLRSREGPFTELVVDPDPTTPRVLTVTPRMVQVWNLRAAAQYPFTSPGFSGFTSAGGSGLAHAAFDRNSGRVLAISPSSTYRLWSLDGSQTSGAFRGEGQMDGQVRFSPDGERSIGVSSNGDRTARLRDAQGRTIALLDGHGGYLNRAAFSPDGALVATGSKDGDVRLWTSEGEAVADLQGHQDTIASLAFDSSGERVLSASNDGTARLWDRAGRQLAVCRTQEDAVSAAVFSPDGTHLLTRYLHTARVWDVGGAERARIDCAEYISEAVFSDDGSRVLLRLSKRIEIRTLEGDSAGTLEGKSYAGTAISPDGRLIALVGTDGVARLCDADGHEVAVLREAGEDVVSVAFGPKGDSVLAVTMEGTIRVWNTTGELQVELEKTGVRPQVAQSIDGHKIVTWSEQEARVWGADGSLLGVLEGYGRIASAEFDPSSSRVLMAMEEPQFRWRTPQGQFVERPLGEPRMIGDASLHPGGGFLVEPDQDGARVWSAEGERPVVLQGHAGPVTSCAFDPRGELVVTTSEDHTARVWRRDGRRLAQLAGHADAVLHACFGPRGERIATASADGTARLWTVSGSWESPPTATVLRGHAAAVTHVEFSPDGAWLATASADGSARLWPLEGGEPVVLSGPTGAVLYAGFDAASARVLTTYDDGTARLWRRDGELLAVLSGHEGPVEYADFAPDGERLLTASSDGTVRVWNTAGLELDRLDSSPPYKDFVNPNGISAAFDASGEFVLTRFAGYARLYHVPSAGRLIESARERISWTLTASQRQRFYLYDSASQEAERLLDALYKELILPGAVLDALAKRSDLAPEVVARAREWARSRPTLDAQELNEKAWALVDPDGAPGRDVAFGLRLARAAVQLEPSSANSVDTLAWALHANGFADEARQQSRHAVELARSSGQFNLPELLGSRDRLDPPPVQLFAELRPEDIAARYVPHGTLSARDDSTLLWTDATGASWTLRLDRARGVLRAGEDCPLYDPDRPETSDMSIRLGRDASGRYTRRVLGLRFRGASYDRLVFGFISSPASIADTRDRDVDPRPALEVSEVHAGSAAESGGLRSGDFITAVEGKPATLDNLRKVKDQHEFGELVPFEIQREGQTLVLEIPVGR